LCLNNKRILSDLVNKLNDTLDVRGAIQELFTYTAFVEGMRKFLPYDLCQQILHVQSQIQSVEEFQQHIVYPFLKHIEADSMKELSTNGLDLLQRDQAYLFVSNHRDIVLDSALINMLLFERGINTSKIAIGDNLMQHRLAKLLFMLNKRVVVKRTGTAKTLYQHAWQLSADIYQYIIEECESVWIAQREGRAKDGNDYTQLGLLKMLSLSKKQDVISHFQQLQIVPVAISYEYDPCDILKTKEYLIKRNNPIYKKSFKEDLQHIIQGLQGKKGHVHIYFDPPLQVEKIPADYMTSNKKQLDWVAKQIDHSIHHNYRLNPINYVACDLLQQSQTYSHLYTERQLLAYTQYFDRQVQQLPEENLTIGRNYMLQMYANPVINAEKNK